LEKVGCINIFNKDMTDEDISEGGISDEDKSLEATSGAAMIHLDGCSPEDFGLPIKRVQMTARHLDRSVFSAPVRRCLNLNGESSRPEKPSRLFNQPVEEVRDDDDGSSTMSSLLDAFDTESQDDVQYKQNRVQGNLTTPIVSEQTDNYDASTFATVYNTEEDMESDDSCDERFDGLTIALNAFWT
jgi:hypothetical protein